MILMHMPSDATEGWGGGGEHCFMRGNARNPNGPTCNNRFLCYLASDAFVIRVSGLEHYYFCKARGIYVDTSTHGRRTVSH